MQFFVVFAIFKSRMSTSVFEIAFVLNELVFVLLEKTKTGLPVGKKSGPFSDRFLKEI